MKQLQTAVIIPVYNEEASIGYVIDDIPKELVAEIIVVDNRSTDQSAIVARRKGARVVYQPQRGYGSACLTGIANLSEKIEVVIFMDGDYSDDPHQLSDLLNALQRDKADLVIGSRVRGFHEKGSLTPQQKLGNWLSTKIIQMIYKYHYTDLGPFRAIRREGLARINMQDRNYGWTVEMQVKALQHDLKVVEIPVSYRRRIGKSKISGTISGTVRAGFKILWTIGKLSAQHWLG
tara:strand:+ start:689 stop:1390 length:702 start_codon:yes stop_codon:yes gene_type:complete